MRIVYLTLALTLIGAAFATGFSGAYMDAQNGVSITLEQGQNGWIQGVLNGPSGSFQLQGQTQQNAAAGTVMSQQGVLGFQAQLSADGQTLRMDLYQMGPNNQPMQIGTLAFQRSGAQGQAGMGAAGGYAGGPAGGPGFAPGGGPVGASPGGGYGYPAGGYPAGPTPPPGAVPVQPRMGQPGMGQPGMGSGQPGMGQPSMGQPGMMPPGAGQPGMAQPGMAQPGMAQPGMGQPGMGQPGMPQPGYGAVQAAVGWNGAFVGDGGNLVMVVQPGQGGTYNGYFDVSGQRYPMQASGDAMYLEGVFMVNGNQYGFYAEWGEGYVYLIEEVDGSEYILQPMQGGSTPTAYPMGAP